MTAWIQELRMRQKESSQWINNELQRLQKTWQKRSFTVSACFPSHREEWIVLGKDFRFSAYDEEELAKSAWESKIVQPIRLQKE